MEWRYIDTGYMDAFSNMAIDEMLLNAVSQRESLPVLRFYGWTTPSISLGYFQKINESIDINFCRNNGINVVRRLTGGRTVLHDMELTYSVIIPEDDDFAKGTITQTYGKISMGLMQGLKLSGIEAEFSNGTVQQSLTSACFEASSRYEIVLGGKKLVGSAQTRKKGVLLQHGSILLDFNHDLFAGCLGLFDEKKEEFVSNFKEKATDIKTHTGNLIDREMLVQNIGRGFEEYLGMMSNFTTMSGIEKKAVEELYSKYATEAWNHLK